MSNSYDKFLRRMIGYRKNLHLTQEETSRLLGKNQSQFSKMELGRTVVSYEVLERLQGAGWDVDYIVTGIEKENSKTSLSEELDKRISKEWWNLKDILIWIFDIEFRKTGGFQDKDCESEYKLLKLLLSRPSKDSILAIVRDMVGISQIGMAEKLGVNIKKYRDLEKSRNQPDAELLIKIYEISFCRPSIFFHADDVERYLLDVLWNKLDFIRQKELLEFLDSAIEIYNA